MREGLLCFVFSLVLLPGAPLYAAPTPEETTKAELLFNEAENHYKLQEYEKALEKYKEVYRVINEPALLYNIAQCYRQLGRNEEALRSYKAFLRDAPDTDLKPQVEGFIKDLETKISSEPKPQKKLPKQAKILYGAAGGAFVLSAVTGAVGVSAAIQSKDLAATPDATTEEINAKVSQAKIFGITADAALLASAGCAVGAFLLTRRSHQEVATVWASPSRVGIALKW